MSKTVTIQLSEAEYRELILCYTLGDLVKETIEAKSKDEMEAQLDLHQKLFKPAYDAELKEAGLHNGLYYYGKEVENEMLEIYDDLHPPRATCIKSLKSERFRNYKKPFVSVGKTLGC